MKTLRNANPVQMSAYIGGRFYSTDGAKLLAAGPRMDSTREQFGETFLFRLPDGEFFATHQTFFDSRRDKLEPLTRERAINLWARLPKKLTGFEMAFPDHVRKSGFGCATASVDVW